MREPTIESRRIYKGRVVGLRVDTVQLPHGGVSQRELVRMPLDSVQEMIWKGKIRDAKSIASLMLTLWRPKNG